MDPTNLSSLAYLILLLLAVGGWVLVEYRNRMGQALRTAAAWGLLFVGVAAGYGLWGDISRDLILRQAVTTAGQVQIPRAPDGHYYLTLEIGGTPVRFMADTGATTIVLTQADAARIGIDTASLVFMGQAATANGVVKTARVPLPPVTLGPSTDSGLSAWVNGGEMDMSLLGMDYLRLYRIEIAGDRMILTR